MPLEPRRVAILVYDRLRPFELGIALEVFGLPRPELHDPWYEVSVVAAEDGRLRGTGGMSFAAPKGVRALRRVGTVVVPGWRDVEERPPAPVLDELRRAHRRGARLVSLCTGAFVLAAAGLLDGRRATTHWMHSRRLAELYPRVHVTPDVVFVDEGDLLTSAGSAAALDACLHVVRLDFGAAVASRVSRQMVVPPVREGGQAQFVPVGLERAPTRTAAPLLAWLHERLEEPLPVARIASQAMMSERTFSRWFVAETGTTPHRWITDQRVRVAQALLETTDLPVDAVARRVGLSTGARLRAHFNRIVGVSPASYRRRFGSSTR
jgi:AraC family transcriptional activator FtrA